MRNASVFFFLLFYSCCRNDICLFINSLLRECLVVLVKKICSVPWFHDFILGLFDPYTIIEYTKNVKRYKYATDSYQIFLRNINIQSTLSVDIISDIINKFSAKRPKPQCSSTQEYQMHLNSAFQSPSGITSTSYSLYPMYNATVTSTYPAIQDPQMTHILRSGPPGNRSIGSSGRNPSLRWPPERHLKYVADRDVYAGFCRGKFGQAVIIEELWGWHGINLVGSVSVIAGSHARPGW